MSDGLSHRVHVDGETLARTVKRLYAANPYHVLSIGQTLSATVAHSGPDRDARLAHMLDPFLNCEPSVAEGYALAVQVLGYALVMVDPANRADTVMAIALNALLTADTRAAGHAVAA